MVESKRCFHRIKERETENNCMLSQHLKSQVGPWLPWNTGHCMLGERLERRVSLGDNWLPAVRCISYAMCIWMQHVTQMRVCLVFSVLALQDYLLTGYLMWMLTVWGPDTDLQHERPGNHAIKRYAAFNSLPFLPVSLSVRLEQDPVCNLSGSASQ